MMARELTERIGGLCEAGVCSYSSCRHTHRAHLQKTGGEMRRDKSLMSEVEIANEILGIVGNLDDIEEAKTYAELYLKALHNADDETMTEDFEDKGVYQHIADVDSRFKKSPDEPHQ